jgi:hypothetical protein
VFGSSPQPSHLVRSRLFAATLLPLLVDAGLKGLAGATAFDGFIGDLRRVSSGSLTLASGTFLASIISQ